MSDSSDEESVRDGSGVLAGFLFGNIDIKTGQLEDDLLDDDCKKQLGALNKLGLGGFMNEVMATGEAARKDAPVKVKKKKQRIKLVSGYDSDSSDSSGFDSSSEDSEGEHKTATSSSPDKRSGGSSGIFSQSQSSQDSSFSNNSAGALDFLTHDAEDKNFDDDYDNEKSPSAIDFSDITESADEEKRKSIDEQEAPEINESESDEATLPTSPKKSPVKPTSLTIPTDSAIENGNVSSSDNDKKLLDTPLAAMLPSKYAGVDVTEIFPDFRPKQVLRFSRLFGPGKVSSLPQVWKAVKKRRRKRKVQAEGEEAVDAAEEKGREKSGWFQTPPEPTPEQIVSDDEVKLCQRLELSSKNGNKNSATKRTGATRLNIWRHGPAQIWYDMLAVADDAENFDYGLEPIIPPTTESDESEKEEEESFVEEVDKDISSYPDEAFHMVTQMNWESNIIWDGNECKHKKSSSKNKAAGWVPSGVNRTAQTFPATKNGGPSTPSSKTAPQNFPAQTSTPTTNKNQKSKATDTENTAVDDTWYSIFPVETPELVYGKWEDDIIWDVDGITKIPEPKVLSLDPNDENIILCIPDDVDPNASGTHPPVKVKIPHPHVKKSKILLGKAGVINVIEEDSPPPSPKNDDKDPYNISNDEYYQPKHTEQSLLKISASGNIIQHSTPVVELRAPFIPTHMGPMKLRLFHRAHLRRFSNGPLSLLGPHPLLPLTKHIRKKAKQREQERLAAGGGDIFFMRTPDDLTGKDGELVLIEHCEEHPPLLNQVGMCSKIKNYYKRKAGKDSGPSEQKFGETTYAHTSPFLGAMHPGQLMPTIENNMFRAPIYFHPIPPTDFVVLRTRSNYFIREMDGLYTAGQLCPLYEVPGPNSKRANNFVRDFLQVFIYRLFWKSRDNPRRIRMEEIKRAFPMHSESSIRKRLKLCADFKRTGADSNWWVIKPEFRLPTEEEIRAMVSPEQCSAYFSLIAAEQRLKDAGYGEKFLFAPEEGDEDDNQGKIDDEVKTAPWNTTRAYIQAMKGKCLLQLTGPADPTGCDEGFSYIRVPNKPQTTKEEQESQPKRIVTGTDADLRRLSLNNAKALLRKFAVPEEEIKKLSRWEVIDVVRTLSTEKAKAGEKGMTKFSRGNRFSVAEHQERYKEECQRIFELQNRVLASSEVLSTDEGESSEEELSDIEEMGKNIENMLSNKKTSTQLNHEKEEQERRELQKMLMGEGKDEKEDDKQGKKSKKKDQAKDDEDNSTINGLANHPGRVMKIHRTFKTSDCKEYTRTEIVRKPAIIDIYLRIRTTKDENFIRQFALLDDQAKEEMKKEKRRLQEQLRRIKRNQEKESNKPVVEKKKKIKLKPDLKMKCGACGQVGHMRTNKACPLYQNANSPVPSMNVAMTVEQEEEIEKELMIEDEDESLIKVDGTKVQLSSKLLKHADEVRRRSLLLKVPKDAVTPSGRPRKKRPPSSPHCDYLSRKSKTNRARIDPSVVLNTNLESILNDLRNLPESNPFLHPVSQKTAPNYHSVVKTPMDLQTIRDKIRQKVYQTRSEFMADVDLLVENSTLFNGAKSLITVQASRIADICREKLAEKDEKLEELERMINPLLDDDQTGLSYILETVLSKVKALGDAFPFIKPVSKKKVKDYYDIIRKPVDLDMMTRKIKEHKYQSRYSFLRDLKQIVINSTLYNGSESVFTQKAKNILQNATTSLETYDDNLSQLEHNLEKSREKAFESEDLIELKDNEDSMPGNENDSETPSPYMTRGADDEFDYSNQNSIEPQSTERIEEEEEGEYVSDEEMPMPKKMRHDSSGIVETTSQSLDDDSQQAIEAMLQLGRGHQQQQQHSYYGYENEESIESESSRSRMDTIQNVHADLEVSDSDNEGENQGGQSSRHVQDDLWF